MTSPETPVRIALVGIGKIARDQHVPAIAGDPRYRLVATASRSGSVEGVAAFPDIEALIASGTPVDAVSICTPPGPRHAIAARAIAAGLHTMLEKPPAATLSEIVDLEARAAAAGVTLYASWHSRAAAAVEPARAWLRDRAIRRVEIVWKEDVRRWHPGQEWIFGPGGFGVLDPGINALSILTRILPAPVFLDSAELTTPEGRDSPIAARLVMRSGGAAIDAQLDFRQTGPQSWRITIETDAGTAVLNDGGDRWQLPGAPEQKGEDREYPALYDHFAGLVAARRSDVDLAPLRLVADAFLIASRVTSEPFAF
jgi:D-galactose 1-dehydrogenase/L-arabinose 1- dehydrogenase